MQAQHGGACGNVQAVSTGAEQIVELQDGDGPADQGPTHDRLKGLYKPLQIPVGIQGQLHQPKVRPGHQYRCNR